MDEITKKEQSNLVTSINSDRGVYEQLLKDVKLQKDDLRNSQEELKKANEEVAKAELRLNQVKIDAKQASENARVSLTSAERVFADRKEQIGKDILSVTNSFRHEQERLDVITGEVKTSSDTLTEVNSAIAKNKDAKSVLDNDIKAAQKTLEDVSRARELAEESLAGIRESIGREEESLKAVQSHVSDLETDRSLVVKLISSANEELGEKMGAIEGLKQEIATLESEKIAAQDEYKNSSARLFILRDREIAVQQKEEFVKERFKQAGVEY